MITKAQEELICNADDVNVVEAWQNPRSMVLENQIFIWQDSKSDNKWWVCSMGAHGETSVLDESPCDCLESAIDAAREAMNQVN